MCRLYAIRANQLTRLACPLLTAPNALVRQSKSDYSGKTHPDGWGLGFYQRAEPTVIRSTLAAFDDPGFMAASNELAATTAIAHVRLASVGGGAERNTHPFSHGRWLFAHNGTVAGFAEVKARLESALTDRFRSIRRGETDSELIFAWLLAQMADRGIDPDGTSSSAAAGSRYQAAQLGDLMRSSVRQLIAWSAEADPDNPTALNLVLTDGELMAATRWNRTLWWRTETDRQPCTACGASHAAAGSGAEYRAVIVASEPTAGDGWQELRDGEMIVVDRNLSTEVSRFADERN